MQSFMMQHDKGNPYLAGGFQGVPPSKLGFVCKPDMPPHINILFRARPPLEFIELPFKGKCRLYEGIVGINKDFNILDKFDSKPPERYVPDESKRIVRLKSIVEKIEERKIENREKSLEWSPKNDPNVIGDPYKTLFVYRLDYKTDEKKLKREFEMYGPIKRVRVIRDSEGKSRGYGFIEFEHKGDFKNAYKRADRKRVDEAKVSVDYERGRTDKNWRPKRFGGGKGETRVFPHWLEKDIKEIKEIYPELIAKFKKEEKKENGNDSQKKSRSRSRDLSPNSNENRIKKPSQAEPSNFDGMDVEKIENIENKTNVVETSVLINSVNENMDQIKKISFEESSVLDFNFIKSQVKSQDEEKFLKEDEKDLKSKRKKRDKQEKKDKKGKKDKKEKKNKKDRKDKKDRKEKTSNDWEAGEIRSD